MSEHMIGDWAKTVDWRLAKMANKAMFLDKHIDATKERLDKLDAVCVCLSIGLALLLFADALVLVLR